MVDSAEPTNQIDLMNILKIPHLVVLPPDSKRIRARLTFPVTTGDGERLLIDRGVTWVEGGFKGVPVGYWRGLKGLA